MSDFYKQLQAHDPHTHLAHLTPNQHTLTCRSINDLVLKWPAYPQIGKHTRGASPFCPPIEQAYLGLHNTAVCEAETLFHDSFTTEVPLTQTSAHKDKRQAHQRSSSLSAPEADTYSRFDLWQPTMLPFSLVLSASLHVVGKVLRLPTFRRFSQEA